MNCRATKKDGTPCKGMVTNESGLCNFHEREAPSAKPGDPAKLKGMRRARNLRIGLRGIVMFRPICKDGCTDGEFAPDWYNDCPHDPYVGVREHRVEVPIYSEPLEDGSRVVERMEERVSWTPWPNFAEATLDMRVNSGEGVNHARSKGWILPEELRSEAWPNGVAQMCQFRGCRWQEGLVTYRNGVYCREIEARIVAARETDGSGNLLYGAMPIDDERKRSAFLQRVAV
jgi:hypothetical protein